MKKQLLFLFILLAGGIFAQQPEFSFKLYFEDAVGNKDTLTLGDDPSATVNIDTPFGEQNIISQPWDSIFDVRATNEFWLREGIPFPVPDTFHTKKQIINKDAPANTNIEIDMKVEHWPVKVSWDSTLFQGQNDTLQYAGSWTTPWEYGQWFDGGWQPIFLSKTGHMFLSNDFNDLVEQDNQGDLNSVINSYYNSNNDTIYTMWFYFADSTAYTASLKDEQKDKTSLFPNPFMNQFEIQGISPSSIEDVKVYDMLENERIILRINNKVYLPNAKSGIYFIQLTLKNKEVQIFKIIKQ